MTYIIYNGFFTQEHQALRSLHAPDVITILQNSPRPLSRKCSVIANYAAYCHFPSTSLLSKDTGVLVVAPTRNGLHAVALYRTKNGEFVYYDSGKRAVDPVVRKYLKNHAVTKLVATRTQTQYLPYESCAYHSLTFLNYASSARGKSATQLLEGFLKLMSGNTDGYAVICVQEILTEFNHNIDLAFRNAKGSSSLLPRFTFVRSRKRKLQETEFDLSRVKRPK